MSRQPALSGIRVLEQGTFITGPCAGMMLADLGADVIKIESPEGDPYRAYQGGQYSPHFQAYNRNKRSLALDMKLKSDCALFERLASEADVYIQNFRPGTAERLGAGVARLQGANPRLVYCSISGFGSSGPYYDRPSYDSVAQALSGFLSVVVDNRRPQFLGPALADAITGMYASQGILAALVQRGRSGRGAHVEVSMLEAMAHFAIEPFAAFFALGETPTSADRPRLAQAYILRTADQRLIAIHLSSLEKFWKGLVAALDAPELEEDPRFNPRERRIAEYETLRVELDNRFSRKPLQHWIARLQAEDVPYAPVNLLDDVVRDPQVEHLGIVVPIDSPHTATRAVRPAAQFDGTRASSVSAAPLLNQHGDDIRAALSNSASWPESAGRAAAGSA
ncbi:MAG TPA: CoA transferase [Steroidobacteraceae bacterium]|jgi:crotonobetainyl-CoA:carnitine CoA-transferase CaiB-like acyl-CoA transferase|nr:CoA transferase [Steroidobacteraceae bacterium]